MKKAFIRVGKQQVHLRWMGQGRPLVLLHASPSSSKMLAPLMEALADRFLVIAPDIPGCGLSQPLALDLEQMADYAHFLKSFLEELNLEKVALYGTATGCLLYTSDAADE